MILSVVLKCRDTKALKLHCVLVNGEVLPTDYMVPRAEILHQYSATIQLPRFGIVTALPKGQEGNIGRSTVCPIELDVHPVHAVLLKDGKILAFPSSGAGWGPLYFAEAAHAIPPDKKTTESRYARFQNRSGRRVESFRDVKTDKSDTRIFDPIDYTLRAGSLPELPAPYLDAFEFELIHRSTNDPALEDYFEMHEVFIRAVPRMDGSEHVPIRRLHANLFCCGHSILPDGRLFVVGGIYRGEGGAHVHEKHQKGINIAAIYNDESDTRLQVSPGMRHGRWYPVAIARGDGSIFIMGGHTDELDQTTDPRKSIGLTSTLRHENTDLEIFLPNSYGWIYRGDTNASWADNPFEGYVDRYPQIFLLPSGRIFSATRTGSALTDANVPTTRVKDVRSRSRIWDPNSFLWSTLKSQNEPQGYEAPSLEEYCSAMLPLMPSTGPTDPGYVATILAAGKTPGQAFFIQPEVPDHAHWESQQLPVRDVLVPPQIADWENQRVHGYAIILADGSIALIGGIRRFAGGVATMSSDAKYEVEVYDPFPNGIYSPLGGVWYVACKMNYPRNYHSTALLLPDGRVWTAGGELDGRGSPERTMEFFEPDYLFRGPRPEFSLRAKEVGYNTDLLITLRNGWTVDNIRVDRVGIIRHSTATHGFCSDQRYVGLRMIKESERELVVRMPEDGNIAPPGPYMLFLMSSKGAISIAETVMMR